ETWERLEKEGVGRRVDLESNLTVVY
ncbi:MAG: hypothetical protein RLY70_326, partial [Planctomycetota bacterium]